MKIGQGATISAPEFKPWFCLGPVSPLVGLSFLISFLQRRIKVAPAPRAAVLNEMVEGEALELCLHTVGAQQKSEVITDAFGHHQASSLTPHQKSQRPKAPAPSQGDCVQGPEPL